MSAVKVEITLSGQMKSGKNGMLVDPQSGRHYPSPQFREWRDRMKAAIIDQVGIKKISEPCSILVKYTPGDRRRRDVPGMMDALCHVLERAGTVVDDSLLVHWLWAPQPMNRERPGAEIMIDRFER